MDPKTELEQLDRDWANNNELRELVAHKQKRAAVAWIAMMVGFGLVILGAWMNDAGGNARLARRLEPWMFTALAVGTCTVVISLWLMMRNGRYVRSYNELQMKYEIQRAELLQEIHGNENTD